ncbi:MAG: DUF1854 domain-containing protein [bacterium]|nr:DUF1854 domain-containing protein [bacterium]MCP5066890.1 DUF1854 domain-containing protein [bacterium]
MTDIQKREKKDLTRARRGRAVTHQAPRRPMPGVELWRGSDGQLWARTADRTCSVRPVRCFPWSKPTRFVSLRDRDEDEVALVRDLSDLPYTAQRALGTALLEAGFVFVVEAVLEVEEEIEIRRFRVRTAQGMRSFQTLRDEWPRGMSGDGLLIKDVAGDLYLVPNPDGLDAKSRRLLWAFID